MPSASAATSTSPCRYARVRKDSRPATPRRRRGTSTSALAVDEQGALDFRGPAVHGKRGERFLYLTWGDVGDDGSFEMFRRAKLMLNRIDPALVREADQGEVPLVATVELTDGRGGPRCARVDPPAITWSV